MHAEVARQPEGLLVGRAEAPAHVGLLGPLADAGERIGVEAEPQAHRRPRREGDHRAGPEAALQQVEEGGGGVEDGVVLSEAAVGDADGDGGDTVALVAGEHGLDQGGEPARVGAEDHDVACLEGGRPLGQLLEEVQQRVAQDLDLAGRPVGPVPADAVVVVGVEQGPTVGLTRRGGDRRWLVGPHRVLDPLEQGRRRRQLGHLGRRGEHPAGVERGVDQQEVGLPARSGPTR